MSQKQLTLTGFNNHFSEFMDDISVSFPNNRDILSAKNSLITLRRMNPKIIITFWKNYIVYNYGEQIEKGDCDFFLKKDYSSDITNNEGGENPELLTAINRFRKPLSELSSENLDKCVKYIQNLSKLSMLYEG